MRNLIVLSLLLSSLVFVTAGIYDDCSIYGICEPVRTLDSLDYIPPTRQVRFLTAKTCESGRKLTGALRDFKKERPKVEFRIVAASSDIHDRYVVTKQQLLILGHGLKDIGGKESFIIRVGYELAPDLIEETVTTFDSRWNNASPI